MVFWFDFRLGFLGSGSSFLGTDHRLDQSVSFSGDRSLLHLRLPLPLDRASGPLATDKGFLSTRKHGQRVVIPQHDVSIHPFFYFSYPIIDMEHFGRIEGDQFKGIFFF